MGKACFPQSGGITLRFTTQILVVDLELWIFSLAQLYYIILESLVLTQTGMLLENNGRYLLQLRDDVPNINYPGKWGLFGGGSEGDETPKQAAVRELKEEIGVDVLESDLVEFKHYFCQGKESYIFLMSFPYDENELTVLEGAACKYYTIDEILALTDAAPTVKIIFRMLRNAKKQ